MGSFIVDLLNMMIVPFKQWNNVLVMVPLALIVVSASFGLLYRLKEL